MPELPSTPAPDSAIPPASAPPLAGRQFNNADSFAQAFDEAWRGLEQQYPDHGLDREQKQALILKHLADHPFQRGQPELALQVAAFRLRLLGL
ncbi:MAG: hypothetical protein AAFX65_10485 [Cyanobacteria bacterium J06638_7]